MASALSTMLAAGGNIRPASAHARHGATKTDGTHTHHAVRIGAAGAWRRDHQQRRGVREKLLARGPFVHGRVIDLSPAAARVLGVDGLAPVSLTVGSLAGRESRPIVF